MDKYCEIFFRNDEGESTLLSKQHQIITEIDKICLIISGMMLCFIKFLPDDIKSFLCIVYGLIMGLTLGRCSNMLIFTCLAEPRIILNYSILLFVMCAILSI